MGRARGEAVKWEKEGENGGPGASSSDHTQVLYTAPYVPSMSHAPDHEGRSTHARHDISGPVMRPCSTVDLSLVSVCGWASFLSGMQGPQVWWACAVFVVALERQLESADGLTKTSAGGLKLTSVLQVRACGPSSAWSIFSALFMSDPCMLTRRVDAA